MIRPVIRYSVAWVNPFDRLYDVTVSFTATSDAPRLLLPVWRPGRYLVQNYAANVREWGASDRSGETLGIRKDGTSSWQIDARAGEEVTFRYRYYAGVLDAGSSFLDENEAYFNGSNLFMMVEGQREEECVLTVAAPSHWRIETQLRREDGNTFRARDYDHLIDSPVIAAEAFARHTFNESGAVIHLIFVGDEGIDTEQFVAPLRSIVRTQSVIFGGLPLREYRFMTHIGDRWHGVEHEDSCSIIAKRSALIGDGPGTEGYDHFLSLASHEFFHVWNVKRIIPAAFHPYDYQRETPTRLLWVMEGVTSFYGEQTLLRAGLWDDARYLKHLAAEIETVENQPGRDVLSLEQASFDAWLQNDTHDRANALISFYNKGEVVAALLDLTIRRATAGAKSLDHVMRSIWDKRVLNEDDFRQAVVSVADVGDFFERYVKGTEPLPYEELFASAGLSFERSRLGTPALHAQLRIDGGRVIVVGALRGGAGMAAGLLPGDELIAIDGARVATEADIAPLLRQGAEMLIGRAGLVRRLTLGDVASPRVRITLRRSPDA
jgi:predicted metalloprotease with PDZ domain